MEATLTDEKPLITDELSLSKPSKPWLFTRENALANSLKARDARERIAREAEQTVLSDGPKDGKGNESTVSKFVSTTLSRTRRQIKTLQDAIDEALANRQSKVAKEFSDALKGLAELERQLSGRPLPGSLRPRQEKQRRSSDVEPEA